MRRSEVNATLRSAERTIRDAGLHLPPFASWTPEVWRSHPDAVAGVRGPRLGWDVTDFGSGRFERMGLTLFTLRNGNLGPAPSGPPDKPYAEKLLLIQDGQRTPLHTHRHKIEDIIHRGGTGRLVFQLLASDPTRGPTPGRLTVWTDGAPRTVDADHRLVLGPGESVTLVPGCFHAFWAEGGTVLAAEVSSLNDDDTDNVFLGASGRFAALEEDEAPYRLLVSDYVALDTDRAWESPR
jgi:D-lyxose ketol-isomerase